MDDVTKEKKLLWQTLASLLCKSVIEEDIAVQLYKDIATGKTCAVIGKFTTRPAADKPGMTEVSFTPLARLFDDNPRMSVEPILEEGDTPSETRDQLIEVGVADDGDVVSVEEIGAIDKSRLN